YIKTALKVLARRKFFTFVSLFGITLTLVVLVIATAILDNAFSPRAPESRFDRALVVYTIGIYGPNGGMTGGPGYKFVDRYVRGLEGAEEVTVFSVYDRAVIYGKSAKIETRIKRTDGAYWRVMDFTFVEGGPFTQADDDEARPVAVITTEMREKLFGGARAVGKTFEVNGQTFRVTGVVEAVPFVRFAAYSDIWIPIGTTRDARYREQLGGQFNAVVLARDRDDFPRLRAAFQQRLAGFVFDDPRNENEVKAGLDTPFEAFARSMYGRDMNDERTTILRVGFAVSALLFALLPAINLVSINLSRIMERAAEIGVRKAFGASARTLVGQFVVENIVLTLIGGAIGFVLAVAALKGFEAMAFLPHARFEVDLVVFLYGMLLAALFGIVSGVYPAWRMARMHPVNALRGGAS
ncbi:MAG TPA: ABC transporter permease, partial [Thermoanaerobaculia bacterium]|nr:ABC transporter permease [Thermoanaerobaculia bacterium]